MLNTILEKCDKRHSEMVHETCKDCSYEKYCPHDCEKCLDYIHNPSHRPAGAPDRKYDCVHMADVYTCKYACRYASEIVYAIEQCKDLAKKTNLKVLSFGCGPCTDLFAIDFLRTIGGLSCEKIEYRGIDYSEDVWKHVHHDIKLFESDDYKIRFYYRDVCDIIDVIERGRWVPDLIVFQYFFSDMRKHTDESNIEKFIETFAQYYNKKVESNTYIILNDINLSIASGGGREYFDRLRSKLDGSRDFKGRFCNDNARSSYYPRGYTYGEDSAGEFPQNTNRFDYSLWTKYSPFITCASAQMVIKKEVLK